MRGRELLSKYIQSGLSNDERFELEKLALDDDFLADAWEGLSSKESKNSQQILSRLDERLAARTPEVKIVAIYKKLWPYAVAASLALVLSVGVLLRSDQGVSLDSMASADESTIVEETMADASSVTDEKLIVVESPIATVGTKEKVITQINNPIPNVDLKSNDPIPNGLTKERLESIPQKDRPVPIPNDQEVLSTEQIIEKYRLKVDDKGEQSITINPSHSSSDDKVSVDSDSKEQQALANTKVDIKSGGASYSQPASERVLNTNTANLPTAKARRKIEQAEVTTSSENKINTAVLKAETVEADDMGAMIVMDTDSAIELKEYVAITDLELSSVSTKEDISIKTGTVDSGLPSQIFAKNLRGTTLSITPDVSGDCIWARAKYEKSYKADPSPEGARDLYNLLKAKGCPTDGSDSFMSELRLEYATWAAEENAKKQAEFLSSNPAINASKAYQDGNWEEAIKKYREAIANETDDTKKAKHHFSIASILFRKLKKYNDAKKEALTATSLNPSFGRPYMLIGNMYATTARSCGDDWNQGLAIIAACDKYAKAKSIDPNLVDEASSKMGKYRSSFPQKEDGFMRGVKKGDEQRVGCWIDEIVKVRFRN